MSNELIYFLSALVQNLIIVIYVSITFDYKYNKVLSNIFVFFVLTLLFLITLSTGDEKIFKVIIIVATEICLFKSISTNTWKESLKKTFILFLLSVISELVSDSIYLVTALLTNSRTNIDNAVIFDNLRVFNTIMGLPMFMTSILVYSIFYKKINGMIKRKLLFLLILIPIAIFPLHYVMYSYNVETFTSITLLFIFICIFAFTLLSISIFILISNIQKYIEEEKELEYLKEKEKVEYEYYKLAIKKEEEVRKINHDIKNNLQIVSTIKKENDRIKYIDKILKDLDNNKVIKYSDNEILNIVLNLKDNEAKSKNIKINYKIENNLSFIEDYDLSNLLTNILDNAIESSSDIIYLNIYKKIDYIVIKESNISKKKIDITKSSKGKMHGYGLKIIKDIVSKYKGEIDIKTSNNNYELIITFKER